MTQLEIFIPTYNRSEHLGRTLSALIKSPFNNCRITILDNASTDYASNLIKSYLESKLLPNLQYIRNDTNIGGSLNYCKAVELSTGPYVWILGDDDSYCWEYGVPVEEDIFGELIEDQDKSVAAIFVGTTFDVPKRKTGITKITFLAAKGEKVFFPLAFAPAMIFKRSIVTPLVIELMKEEAEKGCLIPMAFVVAKLFYLDSRVFVTQQRHIVKGLRHHYSSIQALIDWRDIANKLGHIHMDDELFGWPQIIPTLLGCVLCEPSVGRIKRYRQLTKRCPFAHLFWPLLILPDFIRSKLRKLLSLSNYEQS